MEVMQLKNEQRANVALDERHKQALSSMQIGRFAHVPGKGYPVNKWRRLLRLLIGSL